MRLRTGLLGLAFVVGAWIAWERRDRARALADPLYPLLPGHAQGRAIAVRSKDGTVLHAQVYGPQDAPPIVLAHGFTSCIDGWCRQIAELSDEFRVIAYDQRGHGRSAPAEQGDYSLGALADDLQAVLERCLAPRERAVVAGLSLGGITIASWAQRYPDEVPLRASGTMLIAAPLQDLLENMNVLPGLTRRFPVLRTLATKAIASPAPSPVNPISRRVLGYLLTGAGAGPALLDYLARMKHAMPPEGRVGFGRALTSIDLVGAVPHITVPTVVMVGECDRLVPPAAVRQWARGLPTLLELIEVPGAGHYLPLDRPDAVTDRLRKLRAA